MQVKKEGKDTHTFGLLGVSDSRQQILMLNNYARVGFLGEKGMVL